MTSVWVGIVGLHAGCLAVRQGGLAGVAGCAPRHGIGFSSRTASPCNRKDAV